MNEVVREWIAKAEGDLLTAERELKAADRPNFDAVCFHAAQAIEKLIKAALIQAETTPPKTHDLLRLSRLLMRKVPSWSADKDELRFLTRAAVQYRYPGESATQPDAERAVEIAGRLRLELMSVLAP
jgi:HEPN domain-containing protein